jgi:hypothetical protein
MSSTAFIEPLPVMDFVAQILDKDVFSRPLSDADRVKVLYSYGLGTKWFCSSYRSNYVHNSIPDGSFLANLENPVKGFYDVLQP